jgi:hypothetical protein
VIGEVPAGEVDTLYNLALALEATGLSGSADAVLRSILSEHAYVPAYLRLAAIAGAQSVTAAHAVLDAAQQAASGGERRAMVVGSSCVIGYFGGVF